MKASLLFMMFALAAGCAKTPGTTSAAAEPRFQKIQLTEQYHSKGANFGDLNDDGRADIVTANKKGTFLFLQH